MSGIYDISKFITSPKQILNPLKYLDNYVASIKLMFLLFIYIFLLMFVLLSQNFVY